MSDRSDTARAVARGTSTEVLSEIEGAGLKNGARPAETVGRAKPVRRGFWKRVRGLFPARRELREIRFELLLCVVSGLSGAFIFPRYHFSTLAWLALAPYLLAVAGLRGRSLV